MEVSHNTVNHSQYFGDPETGTHTNTIEGTWNGIKINIPIRNRTEKDLDSHLLEFIWRKKHNNDLWTALLNALRDIHYD